ncbi:putative oxidoreductase/HEAT repeat-containing protein [Anaerohalosphaera lusitana]|uniref:Putative oxidoreductase/HEAT repeat-containing protein n=1 Tax=Anaerohalosphaera lusitana TaxID=1936003 RepID=A0A1U9NQA1_9BACT|nr:HEAT repeat domain-containing protein [Anaerohalosphaera lusitana]AQT70111.1 putative oxidoreductase/HEAT repeat-containing protein [Anaerohalosphaera lusitana]
MRKLTYLTAVSMMVFLLGCEAEQVSTQNGNALREPVNIRELEPTAIRVVETSLSDENPRIRSHAIETVVKCNRREMMPMIIDRLEDESFPVRFAAAMGLGDANYSAAKESIRPLLKDQNPHVRLSAAYALSRMGEPNHEKLLVKTLKSPDKSLKANAVLLLGKTEKREYINDLYAVAQEPETSEQVIMQALEAIAMIGDKDVYRQLWPLLISKYADDRQIGIRAMGALGTSDAEDAIITMLEDEVTEVRLCAAEQLGRMGNRVGRPEVLDYLKDRQTDAYTISKRRADFTAALAIGRIGGSELTRFLPGLLESDWQHIRLNAAGSVLLLVR